MLPLCNIYVWKSIMANMYKRLHLNSSKEVVDCFQAMVGKKKFLFEFKYGQKIDISASSILYQC